MRWPLCGARPNHAYYGQGHCKPKVRTIRDIINSRMPVRGILAERESTWDLDCDGHRYLLCRGTSGEGDLNSGRLGLMPVCSLCDVSVCVCVQA